MKKYFLIILIGIGILMTGCGKINKEKLATKFIDEVENLKSYYLEGTLDIYNNDDNYKYNVKVSYKQPDYFKVVLTNKANNYEQIILRNTSGVYVVNTSLNKSFKFQSEWPYNNSQSYLLQSIATDLKKDKEYEFEEKDNCYIYTVDVNYPNNLELIAEKVCLDKNSNLKYVEVVDKNDISRISFEVTSLDKKAVFKDDYFEIDSMINDITDEEGQKEESGDTTTSATIDDALFPLYLPVNTTLSSKETINTDTGQRVIMTFSGDNSFILVQETVSKESEFTIIPSYGEPYLLIDTVGSLTDTSYTWISNGIEYYIVSDVLAINELLEIAKSINVVATIGEK